MNKFFVGLMAASALYSGASLAGNDIDYDDRIYGGVMLNYIQTDESDPNRQLDDSKDGVKLLVGKQLSKRFGVEVYGSWNEFSPNTAGGAGLKEASFGVDGMYFPMQGCPRIFKPFVKGGIGITGYNSDNDSDVNLGGGVGAFWKLNDNGLALRTDASFRHTFSDGELPGTGGKQEEMVLGAGIVFPFGAAPKWSKCPEFTGTASTDTAMHLPEQGKMAMAEEQPMEEEETMPKEAGMMDADGDGVADANDRCPNTPAGAKVDINGCPVPETVVIYFAFDSAELNAAAQAALDRVATSLGNKTFVVAIANGHADHTGTEEYNMSLSQRRADAVAGYLGAKGVSDSMIRTRAYGETRPAADNSTPLGRAKNRRVEINLLRQ